MTKLIIFGISESAKLTHYAISHDERYQIAGFTVDSKYIESDTFCGLPVYPFEEIETILPPIEYSMFIAIYANNMNKLREQKYGQAKAKGYSLITYIHPDATVADTVVTGDNCFIGDGVICRPDLTIGNNVIVMSNVFLGHYTVIKDHCFIGNRATIMGMVTLEPNNVIGPNATILEDITIAPECIVGGGVVVQQNTKEKQVLKAPPPLVLPLPSDQLVKLIFRKRR